MPRSAVAHETSAHHPLLSIMRAIYGHVAAVGADARWMPNGIRGPYRESRLLWADMAID